MQVQGQQAFLGSPAAVQGQTVRCRTPRGVQAARAAKDITVRVLPQGIFIVLLSSTSSAKSSLKTTSCRPRLLPVLSKGAADRG